MGSLKQTHLSGLEDEVFTNAVRQFASVMRAFKECSDAVQKGIIDMVDIVNDPTADADDKDMALRTIKEALFPQHRGADVDLFETERGTPDELDAIQQLANEEQNFADRVSALMAQRGLTQKDLAELSGVGQPAISMMLRRNCRPQQKTVQRIAEALGVAKELLWPSA